MIYLTGATNDTDEPAIIEAGLGLMIQPGNSYHRRVDRYRYWAADNGCLNPATYVGDDAWLEWMDRLPRDGCLFAVVPDVARRPDGSMGGDPVATWAKFQILAPPPRNGFPVALAAQDGMEHMANVDEQLAACDCLFIAGSDEWKVGAGAHELARRARNAGKWCHMGRVNSRRRILQARAMGCNSADGTFIKYRRQKRKIERRDTPDLRGPGEIRDWIIELDTNPLLPGFDQFERPSLPIHREAAG